jgi:hypothetical protein
MPYRNADIGDASVANLETLYILAHLYDFTDGLVPRNQGEFCDELSFVNVTISAANTTARHYKQSQIIVRSILDHSYLSGGARHR